MTQNGVLNRAAVDSLAMNKYNITSDSWMEKPLLSYASLNLLSTINFFVSTIPLSMLGIVTNTANMIVFYNMGLTDSSSLNFFALSVFDFLFSLTSLLVRALHNPLMKELDAYLILRYTGYILGRSICHCMWLCHDDGTGIHREVSMHCVSFDGKDIKAEKRVKKALPL
ncbi:hypothetical protein ElyMa_005403000 [Elysia marginata]|uniref:G-protein coupled receptors family 1 profile domain-containing protein n=1 Tax=Elysia marginata TaxID=1093978 RepID=A0AAV4EGV5_9GAST|nr:hypothetical protein ElyMa_005403000 [Elysia marginata]